MAIATIISLIDGKIGFDEASSIFESSFNNSTAVKSIHEILSVDDDPLPPFRLPRSEGARQAVQPWTRAEDVRLLAGICRLGTDNWPAIARFVGSNRTRSQCSQRWQRELDPRISRTQWTDEEESKLRTLVNKHGMKSWIAIAREFGNRTDVQCRYRYQQLQRYDHERNPPYVCQTEEMVQNIPLISHLPGDSTFSEEISWTNEESPAEFLGWEWALLNSF
jgi:hypothetical protein